MAVLFRLLSLPMLTLAAAIQWLLALILAPDRVDSYSHLWFMASILLLNYSFGIVFWLLLYPLLFNPLRHLPGPRDIVSVVARSLIVKDRPSGDIFLDLVQKYPRQGLIGLGFLRRTVLVVDPRLFADLLVHNCYDFTKPRKIGAFLRLILGDGLVTVEGNEHKFLRKNIMPAFHFRHINDLYPMMWTKAGILTNALDREIENEKIENPTGSPVVEINTWANKVTLDIIGIAGMGRKLNVVERGSDPLQDIYMALLEPTREKLIYGMLSFTLGHPIVRMLPWKMNKLFYQLTTSLNAIYADMIQDKRAAISEKADDHFDILSLLIKSNNFSDEVIKDQLLTMLAAGHETTASAFTWASYLLAKHPQAQVTLRDEISNALPADSLTNPPADLASILRQLPYLNGIIHETVRLYPTVPITRREAIRDTQVGSQFIPKGTDMVLSIWTTNRSPELWGADAQDFRPERWITDGRPNQDGGARSNYHFLTFLHGPRSCIGQEFAKAELRCLLAALVMSFSWELAMDEAKVLPRGVITIKPEHGMYLKLTPLKAKQDEVGDVGVSA